MTEKRSKEQIILSDEDAKELITFLNAKKGNKKMLAERMGVAGQTVSNWVSDKKFPQYCDAYLKEIRTLWDWRKK